MRHDIYLEGEGYCLRPARLDDAAFIVQLRSDPVLGLHIHETSPRVEDQEAWMNSYFARDGDYYFIVERRSTGDAEGTVSLYEIDSDLRKAEWGRWVMRAGSLAATESVLLIFRVAFDVLKLDMVYSRTLDVNKSVVTFQDSVGAIRNRILPAYATVRGQTFDAVEHHVDQTMWATIKTGLYEISAHTAAVLNRRAKK